MDGVSEHLAFQASEVRAEGRSLRGIAMPFGVVSPSHREMFLAGAFGDLTDGLTRWLDVSHRSREVLAHTENGGLKLTDTPRAVLVEAHLPNIPAADAALADVRAGKLTGFSVQFKSRSERRDGGVRVLDSALLEGIGLVDRPSYANQVEVREAASEVRIDGDGLAGKFQLQRAADNGIYRTISHTVIRHAEGETGRHSAQGARQAREFQFRAGRCTPRNYGRARAR